MGDWWTASGPYSLSSPGSVDRLFYLYVVNDYWPPFIPCSSSCSLPCSFPPPLLPPPIPIPSLHHSRHLPNPLRRRRRRSRDPNSNRRAENPCTQVCKFLAFLVGKRYFLCVGGGADVEVSVTGVLFLFFVRQFVRSFGACFFFWVVGRVVEWMFGGR